MCWGKEGEDKKREGKVDREEKGNGRVLWKGRGEEGKGK